MRWRSLLTVLALLLSGASGVRAADAPRTLRFGVVGFYTPRLMVLKYQPVVDYLSRQTGRRWELAVSAGYQNTVDALCAGDIDVAYLGPFTYVRANAQCGAEPVVRLATGGRDTFRSYVMVRADRSEEDLEDLSGARIGFGAELSTSSHLVPRSMLAKAGVDAGSFGCRYYGHHERAALAVLLGEVDACGVRDIVGERFVDRGLKVVARSEPIPNFPFVLSPEAPGRLHDQLLRVLVDLPASDPSVAAAIRRWDPELASGFAPTTDDAYDPVRELAVEMFGPDALRLDPGALRDRVRCAAP